MNGVLVMVPGVFASINEVPAFEVRTEDLLDSELAGFLTEDDADAVA